MTEETEEFVFVEDQPKPSVGLIPMEALTFVKDTFIAIDVMNPETFEVLWRYVGTVVGFDEKEPLVMSVVHLQDPNGDVRQFVVNDIVRGYWASMGYRP